MELGTLLFLLILLACPLMMVWMMRGHGGRASHGGGHSQMHVATDGTSGTNSLDELRRRRAQLDAEIAQLEQSETETTTSAAV